MLEKINLFPKIEAIWEQQVRMRRLAQVGSVVVLTLYFVFLSSLISYSLLLVREASSLGEKIAAFEKKVNRLEAIESKQVFLKFKLKTMVKVLKKEEEPREVLASLKFFDEPGVNLYKINFQEGIAEIEGEASNAVELDNFIKNLETKGISYFSQAQVENITRNLEGNYDFELLLIR